MSRGRRAALALAGIAISAALLRPQIADALVVRGDEYLYQGRPQRSLALYRRALLLDPQDGAAQDRFAFLALRLRDRDAIAEAVRLTSGYLQREPGDAIVRMDRAMLYRAAGSAAAALDDFARVGSATRDPRALTFAGYEAELLHLHAMARRYWRAAISAQPGFPAALHALLRKRRS